MTPTQTDDPIVVLFKGIANKLVDIQKEHEEQRGILRSLVNAVVALKQSIDKLGV